MKQLFSCYLKGIATFTISIFMLLFVATKTNAQWVELGGANGTPFPNDYTGGNYIRTIATDAAGNVYANSVIKHNSFYYYFVAKWKDTAWSALGGVTFNGLIQSIATDKSGNVYAGGNFSAANDSGFIAKWNGTVWSYVGGTPFNGFIRSIALDADGNVYAAGNLHDNTNGKFYVAKWDGTAWTELGGANGGVFNNLINSIATDANRNVYVAGDFTDANHHEYVAKWNGTAWSELGGLTGSIFGGSGPINSIATDASGNVYAGGDFWDINANSYYVAKWDGMAWSELGINNGAPFGYYITSVATDAKGNVYAGGNFDDNNGKHYVNKWNGTSWSELGGAPFNYAINTIAVAASGNVYAGGNFTDSNSYYYVAEYAQNILPVTLVSFTATKENKGVVINWQTANEINTAYFIVQRSTDGVNFTNVGKVAAVSLGNQQNTYSFADDITAVKADKIYYRLQMADNDGKTTYSNIALINNNSESYFTVFPNPAKDILNVSIKGSGSAVAINIFDLNGVKVKSQTAFGGQVMRVSIGDLTSGVYILQAFDGKKIQIARFIKQ